MASKNLQTKKELEVGRLVASRMENRLNTDSKAPNSDLGGLSRASDQNLGGGNK